MIEIREGNKRDLGGIRSLFVSFPFDNTIKNIIKSTGTYAFDPKTKEWELPITSLSFLLDNLTYYDDIRLTLVDETEPAHSEKPRLKYGFEPYPHQLEGIEYGLNHDKWMLLDDPGLGKTAQMIGLAEELSDRGLCEHCLVICGIASLRTNWAREISKMSGKDAVVIGARTNSNGRLVWESVAKRVEQLKSPIDEFFVIINIESLRNDGIVDAIMNGPNKYGLMVFDEAHKAKGYDSIQGSNLLSLSAPRMVAMTGTLLMNDPLDAYVALTWIGREKRRSVTKYKATYCVMDAYTRGKIIGFKNMDVLSDEIDSCSLRRRKEDVLKDLPPKYVVDEYLTMDEQQASFYNNIANSIRKNSRTKELAIEQCDKITLDTKSILSIVTRLRQATTCPSVLTSLPVQSCKLDRAESLVREIAAAGEKVVVFSEYKEPVECLKSRLADLKPAVGTGDYQQSEIDAEMHAFMTDPSRKVFIGTTSKMGTGVTLTSASYMVFVDQPWTDALYEQASDRIHRIGSTKPVTIYNLICSDTIDARIAEIIDFKGALSDMVIDHASDARTLDLLEDYVFGGIC